MKKLLEKKIKKIRKIQKMIGDASDRCFFRLFFDSGTLVAMVYPPDNSGEVSKVTRFTGVYQKFQIPVPRIVDVIDDRIVILDDLGGESVQMRYGRIGQESRKELILSVVDILLRISQIPVDQSKNRLDNQRMIREMDFFLAHFAGHFFKSRVNLDAVRRETLGIVSLILKSESFLHRDFHSRNMLYHRDQIYLVDFQDSLNGPEYYDLVSFAYDSYLDLGSRREFLFDCYEKRGKEINREQLYLTALQRNIKALGTFGFQIMEKNNKMFKKYIPRTIRHITGNPRVKSLAPVLDSSLRYLDFLPTVCC